MSDHVAERLRAANPLPRGSAAVPAADVLARIIATPRAASSRGRRGAIHRTVIVAGVVLLAAAALAIGATVSVRYFGGPASTRLPAPVERALVQAASHRFPGGPLALDRSIEAYAFSSSSASGRVYMTPYAHRGGFCAALAIGGSPVQAGCADTTIASTAATTAGGLQPWGLALTPDMHALLGRLEPAAADDTVRLAFEDGTHETLPRKDRWFAYAVAGTRTQPGHRPVALVLLDGARVVRRFPLDPVSFNTLTEARELVPASDGSRGQNAVRRMLLGDLTSNDVGDGGEIASHTELARTTQVASIGFPGGIRVSVFATPVRPIPGWRTGGTILLSITNRSARSIGASVGSNTLRGAFFHSVAGCGCAIPEHLGLGYSLLYGDVPRTAARVSVRTSDGREHVARVIAGGAEWVWAARSFGARRPVELIGRNASGRVVATRRLYGRDGNEIR
jgi:hypothetical protein